MSRKPDQELKAGLARNAATYSRAKQRGVALVIVMALLVIVLGLCVGFLSRVQIERKASTLSTSSVNTRLLADTAVRLVQAQIHDATSLGSNVAWASQPGMIRTFGTAALTASSAPLRQYKLYSCDAMITSDATSSFITADLPPSDWSSRPAQWTDLNAPINSAGVTVYPILDPDAQVDGFSISAAAPFASGTSPNRAPMPVKWLYVLQDGTVVAPTGSGTIATIAGADPKSNPITGRVAFWTDDETCKVNLNTASEGTYWDVPRADSTSERAFGLDQPAQKEFQTYPGHPATTSISPIFFAGSSTTLSLAQRNAIFDIVPKIAPGGSNGGTTVATGTIPLDSDRLFASTDEFLFSASRTAQPSLAGITQTNLRRSGFFLTASSVAPETNLFNLPKVSMWPMFQLGAGSPNLLRTTAFDRLTAFCSTANKIPYYFQRADSTSPTNDYSLIQDNQKLFQYLQVLTSADIPGFGGNFSSKYGNDRDQILTEMFDYIRSTNLYDDNLSSAANSGYQYTAGRPNTTNYLTLPGHGQVTPIEIVTASGTNRGFGRYVTVSEIALNFICTGDEAVPASNVLGNTTLANSLLTSGQRRIQTAVLTELFSAMSGWTTLSEDVVLKFTGLENLTINGQSLFLGYTPKSHEIYIPNINSLFNGYSAQGGTVGFDLPMLIVSGRPNYPFLGGFVTVSGSTMAFSQTGPVYLEIQTPGSFTTVQKINFKFPDATFPVPSLGSDNRRWVFNSGGDGLVAQGRLDLISDNVLQEKAYDIQPTDVVRSLVPGDNSIIKKYTGGDYRLVALQKTIPVEIFQPIYPAYSDSTSRWAHMLSAFRNDAIPGRKVAPLVAEETYSVPLARSPDFPDPIWPGFSSGANARTNKDWDTGASFFADGCFANKPEEGNTNGLPAANPYFSPTNYAEMGSGKTFFSPNRQVASPVAFGSLPTGVMATPQVPWRTLLFRPEPGHFGAIAPFDHLLLDLFWMPVVEPYAISQPFATAGKINMNYQILPFTYVKRSTGLYSVLKNEKFMAVASNTPTYKSSGNTTDFRQTIDVSQTLTQFDDRFNAGNLFVSASEICGLYLVGSGETAASMPAFWDNHKLTGENVREGAYGRIYPRLTTKSNSYVVHYTVQALKQAKTATAGQWNEGRDSIVGEYRGSTGVERYIDPNNPNIPDYRTNTSAQPDLASAYKWRITSQRQFLP
ncbi:hypothetical protein BH09VER1_BH09VER1_46320 [soil metagenome]